MMKSEQINELLAALSKAQASIETAKKKSKAYNYMYADLAEVWETIRKPMTENGLSICQNLTITEQGVFALETILGHGSGQWIKSLMPLNPADQKPQTLGSLMTYYRRYAISSMMGVASEPDDDAGQAENAAEKKEKDLKKKEPTWDADINTEFWKMVGKKADVKEVNTYIEWSCEKTKKPKSDLLNDCLDFPERFWGGFKEFVDKKKAQVA